MKKITKKYIFLDIDGTLVNFKGIMPETCINTLRQAQKNNHEIFLCTGRNRSFIYDFLLDFGFDGIIAGTGSYIIYHKKEILAKYYSKKQIKQVCDLFNNTQTNFILNTDIGSVSSKEKLIGMCAYLLGINNIDIDNINEIAKYNDFVKSIDPFIVDNDISMYPNKYDNCTGVCFCNCPYNIIELQNKLDCSLNVVKASFCVDNFGSGEITLANYTKSNAINYLMDYLGANIDDTIAIGDSFNDCEMIKACNIGIAMGNAVDMLKNEADYVTHDIDDNGIEYAFEHYNLI